MFNWKGWAFIIKNSFFTKKVLLVTAINNEMLAHIIRVKKYDWWHMQKLTITRVRKQICSSRIQNNLKVLYKPPKSRSLSLKSWKWRFLRRTDYIWLTKKPNKRTKKSIESINSARIQRLFIARSSFDWIQNIQVCVHNN